MAHVFLQRTVAAMHRCWVFHKRKIKCQRTVKFVKNKILCVRHNCVMVDVWFLNIIIAIFGMWVSERYRSFYEIFACEIECNWIITCHHMDTFSTDGLIFQRYGGCQQPALLGKGRRYSLWKMFVFRKGGWKSPPFSPPICFVVLGIYGY